METQLASDDHVALFVTHLLNTGGTLVSIIDNLADALIENGAEPDEARDDMLGTIAGTVGQRLASVPAAEVVRAAELIDIAMESVMTDLHRALDRSRRRERQRSARNRRPER